MLGNWQPLLGLVTLYSGNVAEARRLLQDSLHLCRAMKYKDNLAPVCIFLAETALWANDREESAQWLAHSAGPHKITICAVMRLWVAARLATAQQQYLCAATLFGLTEQAHSQIHYAIAGPMRALADAALATVRAALEPPVFTEAFAVGQQMALAEAFATMTTCFSPNVY